MRSVIVVIISCLCLIGAVGCQSKRQQPVVHPTTPKEVRDTRVVVGVTKVKGTNRFVLTAKFANKNRKMTWRIMADANLYLLNDKGKWIEVSAQKPGTSRFTWKEDAEHSGFPRGDGVLQETLVLDMTGLTPGKYRVIPSVLVYEYGEGAHESMKNPYYRDINGIRPGKVENLVFTVK